MASRAGRKRKVAQREPSGRVQRPTQAVLNELNQREAMKVKAVVRNQPHRRDAKDPEAKECATALGRFWLGLRTPDNRLPLIAGEAYAELVRDWRAAHGMAAAPASEQGSGTGDGPAWKTVQGWLRQIEDIETALKRASRTVFEATTRLVLDDIEPTTRQEFWDARLGLNILAVELKLVGPDHPFR